MIFKTDAELVKMSATRLLAYYRKNRFVTYDEVHTEEELEKYIAHVKLVLETKEHVMTKSRRRTARRKNASK